VAPAPPTLIAVPNVSAAEDDVAALDAIAAAFAAAGARALGPRHGDRDHGRTVFTLAAGPRTLADALVAGARVAVERLDLRDHAGAHPHVGVLDVAPVVFLDERRRGAACAEALMLADRLGDEAGLPVFLYGLLAGGRTRAELRRGGLTGLVGRGTAPDFGPRRPGARSGATLVAARAPLVAFNLELAPPATGADAARVAAAVREGGADGLPGVRALGLVLAHRGGVAQVTANVEDHRAVPLVRLLAAVERHAPVREAELVGLAPRAAFAGWPERIPVRNRRTLEDVLQGLS
jgi:glutamate formiminotransferase/glutamate formiminotransferase/formiminotetrahydrofolate cyclodeaminase